MRNTQSRSLPMLVVLLLIAISTNNQPLSAQNPYGMHSYGGPGYPMRSTVGCGCRNACASGNCYTGGCLLGGCLRTFFGCDDGPPPGEPLGGAMQAYMHTHIASGQQTRLMLFQYDFVNDPAQDLSQLNAAGQRKLARLASLLQQAGNVGLEPSRFGASITAARRSAVADYLAGTLGIPMSAEQVEVRQPESSGLRGVEAIVIDRAQIQNTSAQGAPVGNASGGGLINAAQPAQLLTR